MKDLINDLLTFGLPSGVAVLLAVLLERTKRTWREIVYGVGAGVFLGFLTGTAAIEMGIVQGVAMLIACTTAIVAKDIIQGVMKVGERLRTTTPDAVADALEDRLEKIGNGKPDSPTPPLPPAVQK
jgi:hypothetical protein